MLASSQQLFYHFLTMEKMRFHALFEHSSIGIVISNESGVIEQANPYAASMFGYDPGELLGKHVEVLIPGPLREKHVGYRKQYLKSPHPRAMGKNINLLAVKKNGHTFPVEVSLTYFEADGHKQVVSFVNDITERKRAEDDLLKLKEDLEQKVADRTAQIRAMLEKEKELNELKTRFVSMASHEFRTPLGGILTSVSLIDKYPKTDDQPKREKHVLSIKRSVRQLTNILNDFLSLDKLDQGKITTNPVRFNFTAFVDECLEEMREMNEKKHAIEISHEVKDVVVFQDKEMIRNVLINLVSNAIKYSPEESSIFVHTKLSGTNILIDITDQGMGIPPEDQKHLFERFFRAHNVSNLQGTGLGLNIVKRYLDLMGGTIKFTSKENIGTTFHINLPVEKK